MISYWERESLMHFDVIIIGSGLVGLQTAINLKEKYPQKTIAIFERGILPTGASTRNAGFACFGGLSELVDDLQHTSETELQTLYQARKNGIALLRARLGDAAINFEQNGSHELLREDESYVLDEMERVNTILKDLNDKPVFALDNAQIANFGFSASHYKYAITVDGEGAIHTGKMMKALTTLALSKGIQIFTGVNVTRFEEQGNAVNVIVHDVVRKEEMTFSCLKLLCCTNAFSRTFFEAVDVVPGRGQVLITQPIPNLKLKGIYHLDKGYYYFREINGRVLLGGGRNLDFETETTTTFAINEKIKIDLLSKLQNEILPNTPFEIDMHWAGIMAFGKTKQPILHQHSENVWGAFRLGGMGVALGSQLAIDLASKIEL